MPVEELPKVRGFILELDHYRADWNESFSRNAHIGDYPNKGLGLHHHFARLYVCFHVFRGRATIESGLLPQLDGTVNISTILATSILTSLRSRYIVTKCTCPDQRRHYFSLIEINSQV
jgi:hypothetical protein